jgi:hypothetical protein
MLMRKKSKNFGLFFLRSSVFIIANWFLPGVLKLKVLAG